MKTGKLRWMASALVAGPLMAAVLAAAAPAWAQEQGARERIPEGYEMAPAKATIQRPVAVLRWLDKVTARVDTIDVPVNESVRIQTMEIIVRACLERPPEEPPESAAFLDVWEVKPGEPTAEVFRGWMFASSPALSAMEHPVYDLWVLDCLSEDEARAKANTSSNGTSE